jgi:acyl transferase domain-containing protein
MKPLKTVFRVFAIYSASKADYIVAGIPMEKLSGSNTAVYSGSFYKDYQEMQMKDAEVLHGNLIAATGTAMMSNRISHFFNLQGPSMTVDTGCSGGMVVAHLGCQSLRCGESDLSIVGASSLILTQDIFFPSSSVLGVDGKCYAWDERAQGYGRGEGVAALILQPLDAALRDGNQVYAVIKETALNQDGRTVTITSPSAEAQAALIERCYSTTGFNLADTGYVEAHMTGTAAGDTIEAEALAKTFGKARRVANSDPMIVGSVKTNIGHTEPVSGLAAIIKTVFVLKNQLIPPNLNYKYPNPAIPQQEWHVQVPTKAMPWPKGNLLRASVNNFGYGGTNGHMILDAAPAEASLDNSNGKATGHANGTDYANGAGHPDKSYVYILSAKDSTTCANMMSQLAAHIDEVRPDPGDLAFTLAERRSRHSWLSTVRAKNINELVQGLSSKANKPMNTFKPARLGFVFNGQGAQWHAMGRELIGSYPVFTESIRKADAILKEYGAPWSLEGKSIVSVFL